MIRSFILFKNLFSKKRINPIQKNEQLDKIIELLEPSNNSNSIGDKELQLIEINKNKIQKLLDAQYINKQHLDKLIITILFAEIGYLSHTVPKISFPIILAVIIGFIGILFSIESYRCVNKSLLYEEQIKEFEIYSILNLDNYSSDMLRIERFIQSNKNKIDFYEKIMYYCVTSTSVVSFEFLYFSKEFEVHKTCYDSGYIKIWV